MMESKNSEFYRKLANWKINHAKQLYEEERWDELILHVRDEFPIPMRSICLSQGIKLDEARGGKWVWEEPKDLLGNFNWTCKVFAHLGMNLDFQSSNESTASYFATILKLLVRADLQKAKSYDFPGKSRFINKNHGAYYGKVTYWLMEDGSYRAPGRENVIWE